MLSATIGLIALAAMLVTLLRYEPISAAAEHEQVGAVLMTIGGMLVVLASGLNWAPFAWLGTATYTYGLYRVATAHRRRVGTSRV